MSITISVIVPTYNRPEYLLRLLNGLSLQTILPSEFEVIAVDDGSRVAYDMLPDGAWPFSLKILRQENQGEAVARNTGVEACQGTLLVFLDDDILPEPEYLHQMHQAHLAYPDAILVGNLDLYSPPDATIFQQITAKSEGIDPNHQPAIFEIPFTKIWAGVLALPRSLYKKLGGMRPDPKEKRGGWIDMDFAYRAHLGGSQFYRVANACAHHDDYSYRTLQAASKRAYKTARLSVALFQTYPPLLAYIPMFIDKTPINFSRDPLALSIRKIIRLVGSTPLSIRILEWTISKFEVYYPNPSILVVLYRWTIGAYISRGLRDGQREFGSLKCVSTMQESLLL